MQGGKKIDQLADFAVQGANNHYFRGIYKKVINDCIEKGDKVLNLGCGSYFNFERELRKSKKVKITSLDFLNIKKNKGIPCCVDRFVYQTVEKPFDLGEKFDVITFFELIEHIDKTDILLKNCHAHLKKNGLLVFSFPNLGSILGRLELLFGFEPHVLEVSNENGNLGGGLFAYLSNRKACPAHHLRGFTYRAMKELVEYHNFVVVKAFSIKYKLLSFFPSLATEVVFVCKKSRV